MSKTSLSEKVKLQLVAKAAGQCQYRGCGKVLHSEDLTGKSGNFTHFAHVVADSESGPRGDKARSPNLGDKLENLMLLCFEHHRLIDVDDVAGHPESLLLAFKAEHEERIRHLLSIDTSHRTKLLFLKVPIGLRAPAIDPDAARRAVLPRYPLREHVDIDLTSLTYREDDPTFWTQLPAEVQRQVDFRLARGHGEPDWHSLSVFALAPIPMLMLLGQALGDTRTVHVHPKLRNPDAWQWQEPTSADVTFSLERPPTSEPAATAVALALSISGVVQSTEIEQALDNITVDRWELRASQAAVDVVRTHAQLEAVGTLWRQALHDIRATYGPDVEIHLFPAIPNSVAIECGRRLLPKADPLIHIYDRTPSGFTLRCQLAPQPKAAPWQRSCTSPDRGRVVEEDDPMTPSDPRIYHITHLENLPGILAAGGLWCDAERIRRGLLNTNIGHLHIKARRRARPVPVAAGGTLGDYVPFNFCARSVMLYAVSRGHDDYKSGQEDILHLVSSVSRAVATGRACAFTDRHADLAHALYFDHLRDLDQVQWDAMPKTYWQDVKEERQAEFLVHEFFDWSAVAAIGVMSPRVEAEVHRLLAGASHQPVVALRPQWYY